MALAEGARVSDHPSPRPDPAKRRRVMRLGVLLLGVVMLAGCADPVWHVGRPIAWQPVPDGQKLKQETFDCARDSKLMAAGTASGVYGGESGIGGLVAGMLGVGTDTKDVVASLTVPQRRFFIQCMEAKGYQRVDEPR
jgi:hypothetical protein